MFLTVSISAMYQWVFKYKLILSCNTSTAMSDIFVLHSSILYKKIFSQHGLLIVLGVSQHELRIQTNKLFNKQVTRKLTFYDSLYKKEHQNKSASETTV